MTMDIENSRREYTQGGLRRKDLHLNPMKQFQRWMQQAIEGGITDPTAMVLATVEDNSRPWQRIVLLKHFDERGFVFYSNRHSRKAKAIDQQREASLLFPWNALDRQVIVAGAVAEISQSEARDYFYSRPRDSQLAALGSRQSEVLDNRAAVDALYEQAQQQQAHNETIPLPRSWAGYRLRPRQMEFWQGGPKRMHDRFLYTRRGEADWLIQRLAP